MYLTNLVFPDNFFDIVTIQFSALIVTELFNTLTIVSHRLTPDVARVFVAARADRLLDSDLHFGHHLP